jgi:hypothetical protein
MNEFRVERPNYFTGEALLKDLDQGREIEQQDADFVDGHPAVVDGVEGLPG